MKAPTRENLLASIGPGMRLNRDFFLKVYGYSVMRPEFAEQALARLEEAGCGKAREYYNRFVSEYEQKAGENMKKAAAWYADQLERKRKEKERMKKNREEAETWQDLQTKSDRQLLNLLQTLKKGGQL